MFCLLAAEGEKLGGAARTCGRSVTTACGGDARACGCGAERACSGDARPLAAEELLHLIGCGLGGDQEVFQVVSLEFAQNIVCHRHLSGRTTDAKL